MTIDEITDIIQTVDKRRISKRLRELGYVLCNNDRKLGKVGIVELVDAITQETEDFVDADCKRLYNGRVCKSVKGYENYDFVLVNIFDIKPSADPFDDEKIARQTEMQIWAKKTKIATE